MSYILKKHKELRYVSECLTHLIAGNYQWLSQWNCYKTHHCKNRNSSVTQYICLYIILLKFYPRNKSWGKSQVTNKLYLLFDIHCGNSPESELFVRNLWQQKNWLLNPYTMSGRYPSSMKSIIIIIIFFYVCI